MNCKRRFNADIIKLYILAVGHTMKLKFSSYVHLPSMNQIFQYHYARVILCNIGDVFIFEHGLYISALKHVRMLILERTRKVFKKKHTCGLLFAKLGYTF